MFVYERILRDEEDRIRYSEGNFNLDVDAEVPIWNSEFCDIDLWADIYDRNHILEAIMGTRYSILDEEIFEGCQNFYLEAFEQLTKYMASDTYDKYEEDFYAVFAVLYLAFEYNYACKKLDEVFYFDIKEIKEVIEDILEDEDHKDWLSLEILYAQIYDELLEKKEKAKVLYDVTLNKKQTGFAWYKLGIIFEERDRNYSAAYSCMMNALKINPMSYKTMRHAGNCSLSMERTERAYDQYYDLLDLLEGKRKASFMRIIEAEYYYKTCVLLGGQEEIRNGNIYRARRLYDNAFRFWLQCREDQGKAFAKVLCCDHRFVSRLYRKWLQSINIEELYERLEQMDALTAER